jgi:type VI secretion system protein ImpA
MAFNVEDLLKPIPGDENGVGEDLRISGDPKFSYFTLKDRRASARTAEREATIGKDPSADPLGAALSDWSAIEELADRCLREQSKDLEVACWYCEALLRTAGFAGLSGGLELLAGLVETYWDRGLYPLEDEDGVETRLAPLAGLIGRGVAGSLIQPLKMLRLSDDPSSDTALWTLETASAPARSESAEARKKQADRLEALMVSMARSSPAFLRSVRKSVDESLGQLDRLMRVLNEKTGLGGFASQLADPLRAIAKLMDDRVGALFIVEEAPQAEADAEAEVEGEGAPGPATGRKPRLGGRDEALATLLEVAAFFEKTEPQSLVAVSLREVVRRARLSVLELMQELLPDAGKRDEMFARIGVRSDSLGPK